MVETFCAECLTVECTARAIQDDHWINIRVSAMWLDFLWIELVGIFLRKNNIFFAYEKKSLQLNDNNFFENE